MSVKQHISVKQWTTILCNVLSKIVTMYSTHINECLWAHCTRRRGFEMLGPWSYNFWHTALNFQQRWYGCSEFQFVPQNFCTMGDLQPELCIFEQKFFRAKRKLFADRLAFKERSAVDAALQCNSHRHKHTTHV